MNKYQKGAIVKLTYTDIHDEHRGLKVGDCGIIISDIMEGLRGDLVRVHWFINHPLLQENQSGCYIWTLDIIKGAE